MRKIAIAGGTSATLGRAIVNAVQKYTTCTPIILSRQTPSAPSEKYGAPVRQVDYTSVSSLVAALNDCHTVISVLLVIDQADAVAYDLNLLHAAVESGCKRFAPSAWEMGPLDDGKVDMIAHKAQVWRACLEQHDKGAIEVARFSNGSFMNYLALGFAGDEEELYVLQGLTEDPYIFDVKGGKVDMPVTADGRPARTTLTTIEDIGKFAAAACELEEGRWEREMMMVGETIGVDEGVRILEEVTGKNFEVTKLSKAELEESIKHIDGVGKDWAEIFAKMNAQLMMCMIEDKVGLAEMEPVVNRLCPHVKPTTVREFVEKCWC